MIENIEAHEKPISRWVAFALGLAIDLTMCVLSIPGGPLGFLLGFPTIFIMVLIATPFFFLLLVSLCNACNREPG